MQSSVGSRQYSVNSGKLAVNSKQKKSQSTNHSITQSTAELFSVQLKVFDVLGREIATLIDKPQPPGNYKVHFDAKQLASGVYFYRLKYGVFNQSKKNDPPALNNNSRLRFNYTGVSV